MLETSIPCLSEEFFEDFKKAICKFLSVFLRYFFERIETHWKIEICWIEEDYIFFPTLWYILEYVIHEISVGIEECESSSIDDVRIGE
jgi:hypothetical protein